ncbi:LOW QUALITY PROTEIN: hypothetical protein HID58_014963 [Brassica napus]|uniref:Uncharacterized protein n=1 Tax=Brassica napus TaxID=3708 RepID=A0ABQ8DIM4_BRANA|nr:LOW QUALITY PROTEIN: hypothetical protein HID58_014963 [Brassica napus]
MFVLLIGSFILCFVASASDVELLIVKYVFVAVSIATPILVFSNSQSLISLLSMIGVEFRRLFSDIRRRSSMFTYHSLDLGPKNQTDVLECCRQSNDALDEDKYFVFLTFYRESSSVRDS